MTTPPFAAPRQLSQTALMAAAARAAHLVVDRPPWIFRDTVAEQLLGERAETLLGYHRAHSSHPILAGIRALTLCRARYTEDLVAGAVDGGIAQYVVLGAGLDTFAYRADPAGRARVFEVDHPATQEWKRQRLNDGGIQVPATVRYVPLDLETDSLLDGLTRCGFDRGAPAIVSWLGVTMYLTREAITATLAELATLAPGSELVVDYLIPASMRDPESARYGDATRAAAAEWGEPQKTFLTPEEVGDLLAEQGLEHVADVSLREMIDPALWRREDALKPGGALRVFRARVSPPRG